MPKSKFDVQAGIERLAEAFPQAFFIYEARRRPLKVGIRDDILAALDGAMDARELAIVLRFYSSNRGYLRACRAGAPRIDLEGNPAGAVTAEEATHAVERLQARAAKQARKAMAAPSPKPEPEPEPVPTPSPAQPGPPKRLGLRDLRQAAAQRKAAS